jgi:pyruvate kinase
MVFNKKSTEGEVYDIANSVKEGVDCIILDKETSRGDFG